MTLVLLGLVAWAVVAKLSGGDAGSPAAAPPPPSPTSSPDPTGNSAGIPPPPWVRYPNPLEGRWRAGSVGRPSLAIANARLTMTDAAGDRSVRDIRVEGHRVHVSLLGDERELATYRWQIKGDVLRFRLLERTVQAALRLETLTFRRSAT